MTTYKIIVYDDNCPLCCWYTGAFVETGLLTPDGRQAFGEIDPDKMANQLDLERSKDEIPLLDVNGGATLYGIDSLLYILGQRWPWMVHVARWAPINWFIRSLYKFISYNRRVIVGSQTPEGSFDCSPQFNSFYRYLYLAFAALVGLTGTASYLNSSDFIHYPYLAAVGLLLLVSTPIVCLPNQAATRINYLGVMWTPYLVLGVLFAVYGYLSVPVWLGGTAGLLVAAFLWWKRWNVAKEVSEG